MNANQATTLIIDCGTMTGHQQGELEFPAAAVPFFGLTGTATAYLPMRLSNGAMASFRGIYRSNNGMWRVELTTLVPEISTGVFPTVGGIVQRRSDYGAIFRRIGTQAAPLYDLQLLQLNDPVYAAELASAQASGVRERTINGPQGRDFGWY